MAGASPGTWLNSPVCHASPLWRINLNGSLMRKRRLFIWPDKLNPAKAAGADFAS